MEAYGDCARSRAQTFKYVKELKDSRESIESNRGKTAKPSLRVGRSAKNINKVRALLKADARRTVQELALERDMSVSTMHALLKEDLGLSKLCARWAPRILSDDQKNF